MKIAIKSCFTMLVEDATLIQNAATPYPVEFAFSKDWDGFAKTALFEAGGVSMAVVLSEDKCDIPGECLKKGGIPLKIAVYGVKGEERKSTGWHVTSKILFPANISVGTGGSGDPMGDEAYKQIMGIIGDPSTAGFGNKTLTEVILEIQRSISGTASDKEVDDMAALNILPVNFVPLTTSVKVLFSTSSCIFSPPFHEVCRESLFC